MWYNRYMNKNNLKIASAIWNRKKGPQYRYKSSDYNLLDRGNGVFDISIHASGDIKKDSKDWIRNFSAWPVRKVIGKEVIWVHKGFYEAFKETLLDLKPRLKDAKEVNLYGTSLGGAIAQVLNVYLQLETDIKVKSVTTFGSPKPFLDLGTRGHLIVLCLSAGSIHYRLDSDVVPTLPCGFYGGVGAIINIKTEYKPKNLLEFLFKGFYDHGRYREVLKK